jgi:hypothetical protein
VGWISHPYGLLWLGIPVVAAILVVLAILGFVGAIVWVIAVVFVLVNEKYPESLWRFQCGIVRWAACVFAYLASLVDQYPPFSLQTGSPAPAAPSS